MLFAKTPATICGISITHNKSNSGMTRQFDAANINNSKLANIKIKDGN